MTMRYVVVAVLVIALIIGVISIPFDDEPAVQNVQVSHLIGTGECLFTVELIPENLNIADGFVVEFSDRTWTVDTQQTFERPIYRGESVKIYAVGFSRGGQVDGWVWVKLDGYISSQCQLVE